MSDLLLDFDAFFLEHRLCGDLNGGTDDERVWMACSACGAQSGEWSRRDGPPKNLPGFTLIGVRASDLVVDAIGASGRGRRTCSASNAVGGVHASPLRAGRSRDC